MKQRTLYVLATLALLLLQFNSSAQKITRSEYIEKFMGVALEHQDIYGIPASIKMAQALLESGNGNSRLATEANNHFGIKCKKDWIGETISHDDDAAGECFRKYSSDLDSFKDHSKFLDNSPRYQSLFDLDPMDYKAWAHGLKDAGYATNPKYPELLITIIEDNKLYLLDEGQELAFEEESDELLIVEKEEEPLVSEESNIEKIDLDNYTISLSTHMGYKLYSNNGSEFVLSEEGDSFTSLSSKLRVSEKKLRKYNDMPVGEVEANSIVYVKSKGKRVNNGKLMHYIKDGETMHSISQLYGIRLKSLYNLNRLHPTSKLTDGQQIRLM